jgi:hypothetical protein
MRVSPHLKKCSVMFSEDNAFHPVRCDSPVQIVLAVWGTFFILDPAGLGAAASCKIAASNNDTGGKFFHQFL